MATIYQDYRPKNFDELVGQHHIKITLQNQIATGRIANAYLFCGPRGIGKTTVARIFAKSLNCQNRAEGSFEPCDNCDNCREILEGRSFDILEIDAASHTGVDNVRENIIAASKVASSHLRYKVFIIDEVHMLSTPAFNALLKSIEEPPKNVIFILCTTEIHKIPMTIISRCQRFDFKKISIDDIIKKLNYVSLKEGIEVEKEILESIARFSGGHMRDAESLFGQIAGLAESQNQGKTRVITRENADLIIPRSDLEEAAKLIDFIFKKDAAGAVALVNKIIDEGVDFKIFFDDFLELLRKVMLTKTSVSLSSRLGIELGESMEKTLDAITQKIDIRQIVQVLSRFTEARGKLAESFLIQLPVEIAIIELCLGSTAENTASAVQAQRLPHNQTPITKSAISVHSEPAKDKKIDSVKPSGTAQLPIISLEDIVVKWNEVLIRIKKYNHSLSYIMRACEPRAFSDNKLFLTFKYKFHKERLEEGLTRQVLDQVFAEVFGTSFPVEGEINESLELSDKTVSEISEESEGIDVSDKSLSNKADTPSESKNAASGKEIEMDDILKILGGGKVVM